MPKVPAEGALPGSHEAPSPPAPEGGSQRAQRMAQAEEQATVGGVCSERGMAQLGIVRVPMGWNALLAQLAARRLCRCDVVQRGGVRPQLYGCTMSRGWSLHHAWQRSQAGCSPLPLCQTGDAREGHR